MFAAEAEPGLLWDVLGLLLVPGLVVLNGLFVAAEFALVSVRETRIEQLLAARVPGSRAVRALQHHLDVRIDGLQNVLRVGWHLARPGRVRVAFGPPMRLTGSDYEALAKQVEDAVRRL